MGNKNILIIFLTVYFFPQGSIGQNNKSFDGIYLSTYEGGRKLILDSNKFILVHSDQRKHFPIIWSCDTISFGTYLNDNRRYILFSGDSTFESAPLNIRVKERKIANSDSLTFHIHNPIQEQTTASLDTGCRLKYSLGSMLINTSENKNEVPIQSAEFSGRDFKWKIPIGLGIEWFAIRIFPNRKNCKQNIATSFLCTIKYNVLDSASNDFEIYIPDLTFDYISFIPFINSSAKVVSKDAIEWNGVKYIRKK